MIGKVFNTLQTFFLNCANLALKPTPVRHVAQRNHYFPPLMNSMLFTWENRRYVLINAAEVRISTDHYIGVFGVSPQCRVSHALLIHGQKTRCSAY